MKFGLVFLATCAALSCVSCSASRYGHGPTVAVGGRNGTSDLVVGGKYVEELVFGGTCRAKLTYDENGHLTSVATEPPCHTGEAVKGLSVNGEPLVNNTGSITFGTGTSVCYGPPIPSPPKCICTRKPCP